MKQTHGLIAAASLVGLAIGFTVGRQRDTESPTVSKSLQESPSRQTRSSQRSSGGVQESFNDELLSSLLKGRPVQEISSNELSKILSQLSTYDPAQDPLTRAKQNYQLQLLLRKISPARLKEVAESILKDPDTKPNMNLHSVLGALSARDPHGAMAWAKSQPNPEKLIATILSNTAKDDPNSAADGLREGLMSGDFTTSDSYGTMSSISSAMAKLGQRPLLDFIDTLPNQLQNYGFQSALRELPESEKVAMLDELYQRLKDGKMENYSFSNYLSAYSLPPAKAEEWLAKLAPGDERNGFELTYAKSLIQNGKAEVAQEWYKRVLAQNVGKEKEILLKALSENNTPRMGDVKLITSLLPSGIEIKADDLKNSGNSFYYGFGPLINLTQAIQDPQEKAKLITNGLENFTKRVSESSQSSRLNDADFAIAENQIALLNLGPEDSANVQAALAAAKAAKPKPKETPKP
jgi:hypothetical protein